MKERPKEIMTITLIGINIQVFIVLTMIGRTEDGYLINVRFQNAEKDW